MISGSVRSRNAVEFNRYELIKVAGTGDTVSTTRRRAAVIFRRPSRSSKAPK